MSQIMGDHSKRISCLKENVLENLNRLFERWKLTQKSWTLLDKVLKEEYSDSLLEMLNILNASLVETTIKIEWDTNRIYTEKKQALRRGLRSCSVYRAHNVKSCQKLLSYVVVIRCCHTLLSYVVVIRCCHTLLSYIVVIH